MLKQAEQWKIKTLRNPSRKIILLSIPISFLMQNPPQQLQRPVTQMSVYKVAGCSIPVFVGCKLWSQEGSNLRTITVQSVFISHVFNGCLFGKCHLPGKQVKTKNSNPSQFQVPVSTEPSYFTEKTKAPLQL